MINNKTLRLVNTETTIIYSPLLCVNYDNLVDVIFIFFLNTFL